LQNTNFKLFYSWISLTLKKGCVCKVDRSVIQGLLEVPISRCISETWQHGQPCSLLPNTNSIHKDYRRTQWPNTSGKNFIFLSLWVISKLCEITHYYYVIIFIWVFTIIYIEQAMSVEYIMFLYLQYMAHVMLFSVINILYFHISTLWNMQVVPNMAVSCSSLMCFPHMLFTHFMNNF